MVIGIIAAAAWISLMIMVVALCRVARHADDMAAYDEEVRLARVLAQAPATRARRAPTVVAHREPAPAVLASS